ALTLRRPDLRHHGQHVHPTPPGFVNPPRVPRPNRGEESRPPALESSAWYRTEHFRSVSGGQPMRQRVATMLALLTCILLAGRPSGAQDKPRSGGELICVVAAEPPSFDAHQEETFAMLHPGAPQYNTLMRVDPNDRTGTKFVGDLAESWTISPDRRTYTFKIRQGVKFHAGTVLTSKDVTAQRAHIVFPPATTVSSRKATYQAVDSIEAPSPDTIVFRLKHPEASFMAGMASPWNWIYKADILAKDPNWYKTNVMGTGPFKFVEYV